MPPGRARRRVRAGDILVSTVRPYLRGFARVAKAPENLIASTGPPPPPQGDEIGDFSPVTRRFFAMGWRSWSGRRDSNPRPSAWEAGALPLALHLHLTI